MSNELGEKFIRRPVVSPDGVAVTSQDRSFIQSLLSVVEDHIDDERFTVACLSDEVHISTSQINRKLKALTGRSAQQFIRSVRMQRAAGLLQNDAGTVAEVAFMVGFADPGYFSRVYKKYFGRLPSEEKRS